MTVDLDIPGDAAAVHGLADWMDDLKNGVTNVDLELAYVAGDSHLYLTGEAGTAFFDATRTVRGHIEPVSPYLGDAADVFHAYANRLERGVRDFNSYLEQCREYGLTVYGKKVMRPTSSATACYEPGVDEDWDLYMSQMRTYEDLSERVGTWWGELETWIAENLTPLVAEVDKFQPLGAAFNGLSQENSDIAGHILDARGELLDRDLASWREHAETTQEKASEFKRQLKSGNPAVRAAAEAANPREMRQAMDGLLDDINKVSKVGKLIPVAGTVIEIVSAASDIASGESGSSVLVEVFAGAGGGAAVGAGVAAAGGPVGWVIAGVVAGGIVIGAGARWGWEAIVPIDVRESIDGWLYDGTSLWQGPQLDK